MPELVEQAAIHLAQCEELWHDCQDIVVSEPEDVDIEMVCAYCHFMPGILDRLDLLQRVTAYLFGRVPTTVDAELFMGGFNAAEIQRAINLAKPKGRK